MIAYQVARPPQQMRQTRLMPRVGEATVRGPAVADQDAVIRGPEEGRRLREAPPGLNRIHRRAWRGERPQPVAVAIDLPARFIRGDNRAAADGGAEGRIGGLRLPSGAMQGARDGARGDRQPEAVAEEPGDLAMRHADVFVEQHDSTRRPVAPVGPRRLPGHPTSATGGGPGRAAHTRCSGRCPRRSGGRRALRPAGPPDTGPRHARRRPRKVQLFDRRADGRWFSLMRHVERCRFNGEAAKRRASEPPVPFPISALSTRHQRHGPARTVVRPVTRPGGSSTSTARRAGLGTGWDRGDLPVWRVAESAGCPAPDDSVRGGSGPRTRAPRGDKRSRRDPRSRGCADVSRVPAPSSDSQRRDDDRRYRRVVARCPAGRRQRRYRRSAGRPIVVDDVVISGDEATTRGRRRRVVAQGRRVKGRNDANGRRGVRQIVAGGGDRGAPYPPETDRFCPLGATVRWRYLNA